MKDIESKVAKTLKFDGGGVSLFVKKTLKTLKFIWLPFKNLKQYSLFRQKLSPKGAILIEFAFCLPVLILLIYYIHDLYRYKRYYSRMEFVGQQIASMIQNISQTREDKTIKFVDVRNAMKAAFLTIYPGTTLYLLGYVSGSSKFELGHCPMVSITYVKGLENGNASCMWNLMICAWNWSRFVYDHGFSGYLVKYATDVPPSSIYPSLTINPGEVKILVEVVFRPTFDRNGNSISRKKAFGFYLISPENFKKPKTTDSLFNSVVIFTPRPGLFSETPPV